MAVAVGRILYSKFMLWIFFAVVGLYYLLPNLFVGGVDFGTRFAASRVNLGIDLRGGTYITLGVDVDKIIESRLHTESKTIEKVFKDKKVAKLPTKQEIKKFALTMTFEDEEAAKVAYHIIADLGTLKVDRRNVDVIAYLTPAEDTRIRTNSVDQAIQVIRTRVDGFGVAGSIVQRHGTRQIVVQLPGVDDPQRVKDLITRRAHLEFKILKQESSSKQEILDKFDGELPEDLVMLPGEQGRIDIGDDETVGKWFLVSAYPDLSGDHVIDAGIGYDEYGRAYVSFKLDSEGGRIFREVTGNNIGQRLSIIMDGTVASAPAIQSQIGASGSITRPGGFPLKEAKDLALVLRTGSFQAPVTYLEERRIGPSLGQDSISKGLMSCFVGLGLVLIFSFLFYGIPGLFAMLALSYNLFLILLFLSYFQATLTLAGIAGMVLTIGMAIDASILIYERIREELREGTPYRRALQEGFQGAMVVILDSNITTFLTGMVLYYFGGPSIQGFAVTLMVGIVATILSGIYFLRSIFEFVLDFTPFKKISI